MRCLECGSEAVTERPERTAQGYRRFRCRACGKQFNERSDTLLNRTQYPSDVIALVVLWRLRYKLSLYQPALIIMHWMHWPSPGGRWT
jgi:transposase-like protein